jgi:hypothetical protein
MEKSAMLEKVELYEKNLDRFKNIMRLYGVLGWKNLDRLEKILRLYEGLHTRFLTAALYFFLLTTRDDHIAASMP